MAKNMYGRPNQQYVVPGNTNYTADVNGLIPSVPDADAVALAAERCIDEDTWLKLQTAHPPATQLSGLTTNTIPKAASASTLGNSSISDNGTSVTITEPLILTGQTSTPGALTGTLTNAPATGNAQTWLQVSINGVVHFIPAWHV